MRQTARKAGEYVKTVASLARAQGCPEAEPDGWPQTPSIAQPPPRAPSGGWSTGLERAVEELDDHPLGAHDDSELSLAGLQDKLLLIKLEDGSWGRPLHGRPSTHTLKADDPYRPGLVEAEAQCLTLARATGLTTIEAELTQVGERSCLLVSRFDRRGGPEGVRRIHQEDLCQALAIDPDGNKRRAKYERTGGPTFKQAAQLLDSYSPDPLAQLDRLVTIVTFTVLIGNANAHGKNLALLHLDPEQVELAPLYDTVPTALWPKLRSEAAMSIGAQASLPRCQPRRHRPRGSHLAPSPRASRGRCPRHDRRCGGRPGCRGHPHLFDRRWLRPRAGERARVKAHRLFHL